MRQASKKSGKKRSILEFLPFADLVFHHASCSMEGQKGNAPKEQSASLLEESAL